MTTTQPCTTTPTCGCGKPRTGGGICKDCGRLLEHRLRDLPNLAQDLTTTMRRLDNTTNRVDGGRADEQPLPINLAAANALRDLRGLLRDWCLLLRDQHKIAWPANTVAAACQHLAHHARTLRRRDDAQPMFDRLARLTTRAVKIVDQPQNRTRMTVGPCPTDLPDLDGQPGPNGEPPTTPCAGQVVAVIPADETIPPTMSCPVCGAEWSSVQWTRTGRLILARKAKLEEQRAAALSVVGGRIGA